MATITTKYSVGDVVYYANITTTKKQHPCPDCLGTKAWKATSPAGEEYSFACPRCSTRYQSNDALSLNYAEYVPSISRFTIGSVQFNSNPSSYDCGARYMCVETGVGSGSVYNEDRLFPTEDEARKAAQGLADIENSTSKFIVERFNKTLELSDYQIGNALMEAAKKAQSRASSMLWNLNDLFETITAADGKDAILEAVDEYKDWSWKRDKERAAQPFDGE